MFDFGQIVEKVTGLFGQGGAAQDLIGGNLTEMLGNANIDPALLETLQVDQLNEYLANAGIDPAALTEGQLGGIVQQVTENGGLDGLDVQGLLGRAGGA